MRCATEVCVCLCYSVMQGFRSRNRKKLTLLHPRRNKSIATDDVRGASTFEDYLFIHAFVDPRMSQGSHTLRFYMYVCIYVYVHARASVDIDIYIYLSIFFVFICIHLFNLFYNVIISFFLSLFVCVIRRTPRKRAGPSASLN